MNFIKLPNKWSGQNRTSLTRSYAYDPCGLKVYMQHNILYPLYYHACTTTHTHYTTEQKLGLVEIGSVNRDFNFTYLPGEEENSWPGRL